MTTIITVNHGTKRFIELCIKAVHLYTVGPFKHVIIDNGSDRDVIRMLEGFAKKKWIELIQRRLPKSSAGHALSLDWILKARTFDLVCLLDSDAHPCSSDWLNVLLKKMGGYSAVGCCHFRDANLLHPSTMIFKHSDYKDLKYPSFRITRTGFGFMDTGMIVCRKFVDNGRKLLPINREEMSKYTRHRWCGTRRELAHDVLDDQPVTLYDRETNAFFNHPSVWEAFKCVD